jgi:SP family facilitated glucose transporter-like MFS transporter 8
VGISAGCYVYIPLIYVGEISSVDIRGALLSIFFVMLNFGILIIFILGHYASIRTINIISGSIPLFYSVLFLFLPESPPMLVSQDRLDDAKEVLIFLRGKNYNFDAEIDDLKIRHQATLTRKKFCEVIQVKSTRRGLLMILTLFFLFQMGGINTIPFYSAMVFSEAGFNLQPAMPSIFVASMQLISCMFALMTIDKFGRKFLLVFATSIMAVSLFGIATYFFLKENSIDVYFLKWLPLILFCFFVIALSNSFLVVFVLLGELFLQEAKIFVTPLCNILNFLLAFLVTLTFPTMITSLGFGITFFIFASFNFLTVLYSVFFVPELKGASLAEIQSILNLPYGNKKYFCCY